MAEEEFQRIRKAEDSNKRIIVDDWLSAANSKEDQEMKASARANYPGVCRWILGQSKFEAWQDMSSSANPLLWITGIPGAGKSTLASFIIEHLEQTSSAHVLYFYCKYEDPKRDTMGALCRGLIRQAVLKNPGLLTYAYEEASTSGEKPLRTLKASKALLELALKSLDNVYIVIDGLDESQFGEKSSAVAWFKNLARSTLDDGASLRILFSSQNDDETSKAFKGLPSISITSNHLQNDINSFCQIETCKIKEKFNLKEQEAVQLAEKVAKEAKDMFLYAKLVMTHLLSQTKLANLRKELKPGQFPQTLNNAYDRIVDRILDPRSSQSGDAEQLLTFLVRSKRSLKWHEIQGAASVDLENKSFDYDERSFRVNEKDLCSSLVEIRPRGAVELVHLTAKHYLLQRTSMSLQQGDLVFSQICLQYLTLPCFDGGLPEKDIRNLISTGHYSFAEYAMIYWPDHLIGAVKSRILDPYDTDRLKQLIEEFINAHFTKKQTPQWTPDWAKDGLEVFQSCQFFEDLAQAIAILELRKNPWSQNLRTSDNAENLSNNIGLEKNLQRISNILTNMSTDVDLNAPDFTMDSQARLNVPNTKTNTPINTAAPFRTVKLYQKDSPRRNDFKKHIHRVHHPNEFNFSHFGSNAEGVQIIQAVEDLDFPIVEKVIKAMSSSSRYPNSPPIFKNNDYTSRTLWKAAAKHADEEMITFLIERTTFDESNAQCYILEKAAEFGQAELVKLLVDKKYRKTIHGSTIHGDDINAKYIPWDRAINVACSHGDAETTKILISGTLSNLVERTPRIEKRLQGYFINACRSGHLELVQCFISEYGLNPFQYQKGKRSGDSAEQRVHPLMHDKKLPDYSNGYLRSECRSEGPLEQMKEWGRSSILYHAAETGHRDIVRYLLQLENDGIFSGYERIPTLLSLAAANGYMYIVEMISKHHHDQDDFMPEVYTLRAKVYNAVRDGREQLAMSAIASVGPEYDVPDMFGCSLLMHAALKGLKEVVKFLLEKDVDVNRRGYLPEDEYSASKKRNENGEDWLKIRRYNAIDLAKRKGHNEILALLKK